jgi:hypothetical protein
MNTTIVLDPTDTIWEAAKPWYPKLVSRAKPRTQVSPDLLVMYKTISTAFQEYQGKRLYHQVILAVKFAPKVHKAMQKQGVVLIDVAENEVICLSNGQGFSVPVPPVAQNFIATCGAALFCVIFCRAKYGFSYGYTRAAQYAMESAETKYKI